MNDPAFAIEPADSAHQPVLALSADGTHLARVHRGELFVDDKRSEITGAVSVAVLDHSVWCITRDELGSRLERVNFDGRRIDTATALGSLGGHVRLAAARRGMHALVSGERELELKGLGGGIAVTELGARARNARILVPGRGVLERRGGSLVLLRAGTVAELSLTLPVELCDAVIEDGAVLLDGAMIAIELAARDQHIVLTYDARRGALQSRVRISDAAVLAIAERAGVVVIGRDRHLALVELRGGRCRYERVLATPVCSVAIDAAAERIVVTDASGRPSELGALLRDRDADRDADRDDETANAEVATAGVVDAVEAPADEQIVPQPLEPSAETATAASPEPVAPPSALVDSARIPLLGFGPPPACARLADDELEAYLDDLRAWVDALCAAAHARRRLGTADVGDAIVRSRELEDSATRRLIAWSRRGVPHVELAQELALSPLATSLLIVIAAPQIWGELAGAYGAISADCARPLVDELLVAHLLDAGTTARSAIAGELDEGAPLVASGAVIIASGLRPYAQLSVHAAVARRLAGACTAGDPHDAPCSLDTIVGPRVKLAALARHLAVPADAPTRVVLRGRDGSGRSTIAAALAAQAGRAVREVAIESGADADRKLRGALRDVALRGDVPCVTLDEISDDPSVRIRIRGVLDAHRGPVIVRAPLAGELPLAPGYAVVELPPLSETQRLEMWRRCLTERGVRGDAADELATRFPVGPGTIARACADLDVAAAGTDTAALAHALATSVRQHRSSRIADVANRVDRLATWNDLVVPEEIADSLREMVARLRHRRTVLETWGMDRVAATAQGVTALFQGGPGTGKTMAAGVIARALGYELWRVDLSKIVSKWLGETEKNLSRVFDAAEDGEVVLLFDEADSLFSKRTDVKTSNDRSANLETNYLLQRLDAFTGLAILTTNFGTAIDAAFKRRLAVEIHFPFPDETEREQLWRAHLPPQLPLAGDVDLVELARRYQLSGGYIRNTALRAAYLAAADGKLVGQGHLERAVKALYRDQAKVATGGRME
jgi:broad-specificity NMP kinase